MAWSPLNPGMKNRRRTKRTVAQVQVEQTSVCSCVIQDQHGPHLQNPPIRFRLQVLRPRPQIIEGARVETRATVGYPKMSFTLSKIDDPRSAGLLSTLSVPPNCSTSLRCSRVSFVGVRTRTW